MTDDSLPKVTVVITTYNQASYVTEALESVIAQEAPFAWDIVIGDDASTDGTRELVQAFATRHPDRVRLVLPDRNLGGNGNPLWFLCLDAARGEYIACLDGDDYWTAPDKLRVQVEWLDAHPESLACFHNVVVERDGWTTDATLCQSGEPEAWTVEMLLTKGGVQTSSMLLRGPGSEWRRRLAAVPDDALTDWGTVVMAASAVPVGYVDRVMSAYRQHASGAWSTLSRGDQVAATIRLYDAINAATGFTHDAVVQDEVARRSYEAFSAYERAGKLALARVHLARCLALRPAWLERYAPGVGGHGSAIWSVLERRLELCAHPWRFRAHRWLNGVRAWARWEIADIRRLWTLRRSLKARVPWGVLVVQTPSITEKGFAPGLGNLTLEWAAIGATEVEVRLDNAAGPLLARGGPTGTVMTGMWVHDGMVFLLRDVSADPAATLDVTRVRVKPASPRRERPRVTRAESLARERP